MTASMTAFARAEKMLDRSSLIWEIRSVNHRYLDINLKLPEELRALDTACREVVAEDLKRGRIDAILKIEKTSSGVSSTSIDTRVMESVILMLDQISNAHPGLQPAKTTDILNWPGVITENPVDAELLSERSLDGLRDALSKLNENRHREGNRLGKLIGDRVTLCREVLSSLMDNISDIQQGIKNRWQQRVEEIVENIDQERIAQEIAILLTKSDVSEELDRLVTHLDEVELQLGQTKPVGRNLDFLMQELNREANTLGSKSVDPRVTAASIELKVLIDQMREQVQNIE
jgi:uncharacterized protein (TIGR00255 family)